MDNGNSNNLGHTILVVVVIVLVSAYNEELSMQGWKFLRLQGNRCKKETSIKLNSTHTIRRNNRNGI